MRVVLTNSTIVNGIHINVSNSIFGKAQQHRFAKRDALRKLIS